MYAEYKDLKTPQGVNFAKCMKTGMDNPGHTHNKKAGLVAGDEQSFTMFKKVFDGVISDRHDGFPEDGIRHEGCHKD